jgi:hypothetical protein
LHTNVSSPMAAGFSQSGSIATPNWCNEAESSSLSLRLASSSNRASRWGLLLSVPTRLHVGHSVNTLTTFQANREVRLSLTHQRTPRRTNLCIIEPEFPAEGGRPTSFCAVDLWPQRR